MIIMVEINRALCLKGIMLNTKAYLLIAALCCFYVTFFEGHKITPVLVILIPITSP